MPGQDGPRSVVDVMHSVPFPSPQPGARRIMDLSARELEILDDLASIFTSVGFARSTMRELATRVQCSFRELYRIGGSKESLFLMVADRLASAHGRAAMRSITPAMSGLEAVRTYLIVGNELAGVYGERLAADIEDSPMMAARHDQYASYGVDVVQALLDFAIASGELPAVDTGALARMLATTGRDFTRPDAMRLVGRSPSHAANQMVDLILDGLRCQTPGPFRAP